MVQFNFDATQIKPEFGGLGGVPPGKMYKGIVKETVGKPAKSGQGEYLNCVIAVIDGPYAGRLTKLNFNLFHTNPQTVEIAKKELSALCHCVGVFKLTATEMLHGKPFCFDVDWQAGGAPTAEKPEGGFTEITAIYDINGNKPGQNNQQGGGNNGGQQQQQGGSGGFGGGQQQNSGGNNGGFGGGNNSGGGFGGDSNGSNFGGFAGGNGSENNGGGGFGGGAPEEWGKR